LAWEKIAGHAPNLRLRPEWPCARFSSVATEAIRLYD
jgi:hypothetical protein